jgi:hypothetical protein
MSPIVKQPGLVNSQASTWSNPGFSSKVGPVSGCVGSVNSTDALNRTGIYNIVQTAGITKSKCKCKCKKSKSKCKCKKCKCACHKSCKSKRRLKGGNGYGFSTKQTLAPLSGSNGNLGSFNGYQNVPMNSDTNMNAYKISQSGGDGHSSFGAGGTPYYSYKNPNESLSKFAGSGYPPLTRQHNNQCGGKRTYRRNKRKSSKKKKPLRRKSYKKQRGGNQFNNNVANTPSYSTGAPPSLTPSLSALANPVPYEVNPNGCLNMWKHLDSSYPPYNDIYM